MPLQLICFECWDDYLSCKVIQWRRTITRIVAEQIQRGVRSRHMRIEIPFKGHNHGNSFATVLPLRLPNVRAPYTTTNMQDLSVIILNAQTTQFALA